MFVAAAPRVLTDHASRLAGVLVAGVVPVRVIANTWRACQASSPCSHSKPCSCNVFHVLLIYGQGVGLAVLDRTPARARLGAARDAFRRHCQRRRRARYDRLPALAGRGSSRRDPVEGLTPTEEGHVVPIPKALVRAEKTPQKRSRNSRRRQIKWK